MDYCVEYHTVNYNSLDYRLDHKLDYLLDYKPVNHTVN
jgi:hypothetical protein